MRELEGKYELLEQYGIEPDSAVRLASFEAAYMQDPHGVISSMVDQLDLPDTRKTALKEMLSSGVPAEPETPEGVETPRELPAEVKEAVTYVREQQARDAEAQSQARLQLVVDHWKSLDTQDNVSFPDRVRLQYISTAAAQGGFQTLEQLSEAARTMALEDRDVLVGSTIQRPSTGTPRPVPTGGVLPTQPIVPKTMDEARKLIDADIAAGRFPDLRPGG
jgi:hypothetical protein